MVTSPSWPWPASNKVPTTGVPPQKVGGVPPKVAGLGVGKGPPKACRSGIFNMSKVVAPPKKEEETSCWICRKEWASPQVVKQTPSKWVSDLTRCDRCVTWACGVHGLVVAVGAEGVPEEPTDGSGVGRLLGGCALESLVAGIHTADRVETVRVCDRFPSKMKSKSWVTRVVAGT